MPSPARPSTVQKEEELILENPSQSLNDLQLPPSSATSQQHQKTLQSGSKKAKDMSQWFSLFADLDPLANPDAIGKSTKESDPNCYS